MNALDSEMKPGRIRTAGILLAVIVAAGLGGYLLSNLNTPTSTLLVGNPCPGEITASFYSAEIREGADPVATAALKAGVNSIDQLDSTEVTRDWFIEIRRDDHGPVSFQLDFWMRNGVAVLPALSCWQMGLDDS